MPGLAVAFDDNARESLLGNIRVSGIPCLVVLDGNTGAHYCGQCSRTTTGCEELETTSCIKEIDAGISMLHVLIIILVL
jgi:hypothetical protein